MPLAPTPDIKSGSIGVIKGWGVWGGWGDGEVGRWRDGVRGDQEIFGNC
ncbi:hypothetical protein [Okeania sp. KiyG1]|nr:hypothetical protein [Okeania sp. KiyG1]